MYTLPVRVIQTDDGPVICQLAKPATPTIGIIVDESGSHVYESGDESAYSEAMLAIAGATNNQ